MWNRFSLLPHVVIYIGERLCHTSGNGIEGGALFGELVTAYLFLAGVGAGGVAAASVADPALRARALPARMWCLTSLRSAG